MGLYVDNQVKFEGDEKLISECCDFVKGDNDFMVFDFTKIIPPKGEIDWKKKHWGTPLNADMPFREEENIYVFSTAWKTCSPVILALSKKFPALKITLSFECVDFDYSGYKIYENGEITEEEFGDYEDYSFMEE